MKTWLRGHSITRDEVQGAYDAWLKSRAGKKHSGEVDEIHGSPEALVDAIFTEIRERRLEFEPIRYFMRRERTNGKMRQIGIQSIKQQVCDYLAVRALQPMLDAKLGYYQCASVPGKGQVFAKRHLEKWYAQGGYFVKLDVRKCFPSVDQSVVIAYLEKNVGSADVVYLVSTALSVYGNSSSKGGLNIGSYLSQYLANLVLSMVYHHIEELHKERRGKRRALIRHQLWYMDDLVMFCKSRRDLVMAAREVERFIAEVLHMQVKAWKVCKCGADRLDMVGYVIGNARTELRSGLFIRLRRAFTRMSRAPCVSRARRCISYWGFLRHSGCGLLRQRFKATFDECRRIVAAWERKHLCSVQTSRSASRFANARTGWPIASSGATSTK